MYIHRNNDRIKNSAAISTGQSTIKNDRLCSTGDYIIINILQFHS